MSHVIRYVRVLGNAISATTLRTDCILLEREREEGRGERGERGSGEKEEKEKEFF